MRFNTAEEVAAWAKETAVDDYRRHIDYGHDMNPFCTQGARNDWQRGFDNAPPYSWEEPTRDFDTIFQRGRAMAKLIEEKS